MQIDARGFVPELIVQVLYLISVPLPYFSTLHAICYTCVLAQEIPVKKSPRSTIDINFSSSDSDSSEVRSLNFDALAASLVLCFVALCASTAAATGGGQMM